MALVLADRVKETTTTTGTGTYTLAGAVTGFESFGSIGDGNTTYYCCTDGDDFEVGIGTYTSSGTTLARTTILESSNSDAAVNWTSGTRTIFCTLPADKTLFKDASSHLALTNLVTNTGAIELAGGVSYDPTSAMGSGSGTDTATDVGIALGSGTRIVGSASGYIRTLLEWNNSGTIDIGQTGTALISGTNIYAGASGSVSLYKGSTKRLQTTSSGVSVTGNIAVSGTVDGRDLATDGTKLDGIATGAEVNQNAFSNVAVSGQTTVAADGKTDTLTLAAGSNVTITTNATTDTVTIAATDTNTTYTAGTGLSLNGTEFDVNVNATAQTTAANTVTSTASRTYAVQVDGSDNLVVNVPWVDTNTTYTNVSSFTNDAGYLTSVAFTDIAGAAVQTSGESFSDSDTVLMTAASIEDRYLKSNSVVFPFFQADGTSDTIALTADSKLPFTEADGTANNIPLTT